MHRTQSDFDDNLTFKVFIFQCINFYSSIIYIAFFKGRFVGYPGRYKHIYGDLRNEDVRKARRKFDLIFHGMPFYILDVYVALSVLKRRVPDRVGSTIGCHYGRETDHKQLSGNFHSQTEGVVAQQEGISHLYERSDE